MRLFASSSLLALLASLLVMPGNPQEAQAGGCGYGGCSYPVYGYQAYSYPTYYYPTYSYSTPVYYSQQSYSVPYYNGQFHYHNAGWSGGRYYKAGNYAWRNGGWVSESYDNGSYGNGWQDRLLSIAANRDHIEGELRLKALDQQAYLSAVKTLGLEGNFHWQNYGQAPLYPVGQSYNQGYPVNLSTAGVNGNTVYGYSYSSVKDVYGDTNLGSLFQQSARLADGAQQLSGQATQGFQDTVMKEGGNRARVAEILAKAQAAKAALDAANAAPSSYQETRIQGGGQSREDQRGEGQAAEGQGAPAAAQQQRLSDAAFGQLLVNRCGSCHGNDGKAKGGFRIGMYAGLSLKDKAEKVWPLLTTSDENKRMPRTADGKAGRLAPEELQQFFTH